MVVLANTNPLVWRRIQVPETYSFWDLHVAIQDAMGWQDYHLHEFEVIDSRTDRLKRIGIPDEDMPRERPCAAGWKVPIARYLTYGARPVRYRYDFGDDWEHALEFEELVPDDGGVYPRCVAGAGKCPPEDVGGTHGYAEFLSTIGASTTPNVTRCSSGLAVDSIPRRFARPMFDSKIRRNDGGSRSRRKALPN